MVTFSIQDDHGHTYIASSTLNVIDPKPIACINGPSTVKAGRPLPSAITSCSYSPVNATPLAETWTNKLAQYNTAGTEVVKLIVKDTALRSSVETTKSIVVAPDQPPVANLSVPAQTTRGQTIALDGSQASSPDGDIINRYKFEYQYDAANDGFSNDVWTLLYDGANSSVTSSPAKIGKYNVKLTVWENYGQSGTSIKVVDTLNLAPTVDVQTSGQTTLPVLLQP
jgi:PKD repeat protein